jgi:3-deoxy-D-manno-octulosonate 8-phosphate phosphatase KdsC-like HAD superfamily phosphatase
MVISVGIHVTIITSKKSPEAMMRFVEIHVTMITFYEIYDHDHICRNP